jgi:hypothetical protein
MKNKEMTNKKIIFGMIMVNRSPKKEYAITERRVIGVIKEGKLILSRLILLTEKRIRSN